MENNKIPEYKIIHRPGDEKFRKTTVEMARKCKRPHRLASHTLYRPRFFCQLILHNLFINLLFYLKECTRKLYSAR
jgi:hypothetical protein